MWKILNPTFFLRDEKRKNKHVLNHFLFEIAHNNKFPDNKMDSLRFDVLSRHNTINDNDRIKLKERRLNQIYSKSNSSNFGPKHDFIVKYKEIYNLATVSMNSSKNISSHFDGVISKLEKYNKYSNTKPPSKTSSVKKFNTKNIFEEIKDESNSFNPVNFTDNYINTIRSMSNNNLSPIKNNSKFISSSVIRRNQSFNKYNKYSEGGGTGEIKLNENSLKYDFEKLSSRDYYKTRTSSAKNHLKKKNFFGIEKNRYKYTPSKYNNEIERFRWPNQSRRFEDFSYNKSRNESMNYKFNALKAKLDLLLVK